MSTQILLAVVLLVAGLAEQGRADDDQCLRDVIGAIEVPVEDSLRQWSDRLEVLVPSVRSTSFLNLYMNDSLTVNLLLKGAPLSTLDQLDDQCIDLMPEILNHLLETPCPEHQERVTEAELKGNEDGDDAVSSYIFRQMNKLGDSFAEHLRGPMRLCCLVDKELRGRIELPATEEGLNSYVE